MQNWFVYIIKTRLDTLYTGVTTDVERRVEEHRNAGSKGARYLRGKAPLTLVWHESGMDKQTAMRVEYQIKRLPRAVKDKIITRQVCLTTVFPELFDSVPPTPCDESKEEGVS